MAPLLAARAGKDAFDSLRGPAGEGWVRRPHPYEMVEVEGGGGIW